MNYIKITENDIANGVGIGCVLWTSGCSLHCKNCQNPQTWDFDNGYHFDNEVMRNLLYKLNKPYIHRLTITGGHPLEPQNIDMVFNIIKQVKIKYPEKTIWLYSGYEWTEIYRICKHKALSLELIDVIVDGEYIDEQRDLTLPFRGSRNQRVIDVKKSLKLTNGAYNPVLYCE